MQDRLAAVAPEQDLIVIGGGIHGAGVARDAALRGLRVALFEKGDFASGASSKSSKLVHGGLRYLEHGAFRLVWEACRERRILLGMAPHLVRPLPFVFPVYADSRLPSWQLRLGMWLYDVLAGFRNVQRHRMLSPASAWSAGLRRAGLRTLALYHDAVMDDARLVLANVIGAGDAGASTLNYCTVRRWVQRHDRVCGVQVQDNLSGKQAAIYAPLVVCCTGPWTNLFLGPLAGTPALLAPTRGTHLIVPSRVDHGFTLAAGRDGRIFFVLPWQGFTLIGTTDQDDGGSPDQVTPQEDEIEYLLQEANHFFPHQPLRRQDVIAAFAGLRPLLRADGDASSRSREHTLFEPLPGLLCVAGGKYTTYRAVAQQVVDEAMRRLQRRSPCRTADLPLPGGSLAWTPQEHWNEGPAWQEAMAEMAGPHTSPDWVRHLLRTHGSRAANVLALAQTRENRRLCAHLPFRVAEVLYAIRHEMALCLGDWYFRRSPTAYSPCQGVEAVEAIADLFAHELGWSASRRQEQILQLRRQLQATAAVSPAPASSR